MAREGPGTLPRLVRLAFCAIAALALCGCAMPLREQLDMLAVAPVCCGEISEFRYAKLLPEETREISLDEKSPAFVFASGKSFFAAFELPAFTAPYAVSLSSRPRPLPDGEGTVLRPKLMLLDESFRVTRTLSELPFRVGTAHALVKEFFVNPANRNERYLVVHTAPGGHETQDITTFSPVGAMVGTVYVVFDGHQASHKVANAAIGSLTLTLKPYVPSVLGREK